MTKQTPPSSPTKRMTRSSKIAIDSKPKSVTKKALTSAKKFRSLSKQTKKAFHSSETTEQSQKPPIVNILDFNKRSGITMYLVQRDGIENDVWETEESIEDLEVLSAYQQKVQTDSGYLINQNGVVAPVQEDNDAMVFRKPLARVSKIRAVMALKQSIYIEDDEEINLSTKRKSVKSDDDREVSVSKRSGNTGRKTKAQVLMEIQIQERLERKKQREQLDVNELICCLDQVQGKDCCMMCASNTYRELLERGDMEGFKALFEDRENIPSYDDEDKPNGLDLISYAIILEKFDFAEYAHKKNDSNALESVKRPSVPYKYKVYGDNTGHNRGFGSYSNRNFRQVQESRGNRLGNSAFYRNDTSSTYPRRTFMNLEDFMSHCSIRCFLPYISKGIFQKTEVVDNCVALVNGGPLEVYIAVMAGNRLLASKLLEHAKKVKGRNTFNHLHEEILKYKSEVLTSYRRPQIIKMASDAFNITPYHCAAIHPSSSYLAEFYEALDAAERLETDSFGRSIAFYAAVSETTACLEYLISKNFNLTIPDKYKMTPLLQAARFGRSHNVELLIKFQIGDNSSNEASSVVFQSLVRNRRTALHYAAFFGHADTCKVLIKYGAAVEPIENLDKQTPLHFAAKNGYLECVRVLIEDGGANPEKGDKFSRNALHLACIYGHVDIVRYLLSVGVNADSSDSSQNSPAHYASAYGYIKILHLLIAYGSADPASTNVWRSTPCSVANMKGHLGIVKYLLQLPGHPIDVNFKDPEGLIMLQHAISEHVSTNNEVETNLKKVELLISMDADVNSVDIYGCTSMHTLAKNTKYNKLLPKQWSSFYPQKTPTYFRFWDHPTNLEDDMDGIHYHIRLAKLLIERGADLNIKNDKGETPLLTAMDNKHYHLAATLLEAGSKFWIDTDEKGNNFFHHYGYLISRLGYFQPHFSEDVVKQQRWIAIAKKIWDIIESKLTSEMDLKYIINAKNDSAQSPLMQGLYHAITNQKLAVAREKRLIKYAVPDSNQYNGFGNRKEFRSSQRYLEHKEIVDIDLRFNFEHYIEFTQRLIDKTKPDMNSTIGLPKEFTDNNPKAKRSEYPELTGFGVLHLACQTQSADLIKFLITNGADPNARVNIDGWLGSTPFLIVYHMKEDRKQELPDEKLETLEFIKKSFRIKKPDFKEMLHQCVQVLLEFGACPFITNASGDSPISRAAAKTDVINLQLMCSAKPSKDTNVNAQNENGQTALMTAVDSLEAFIKSKKEQVEVSVIKSLLNANANPNVKYDNGDTVLIKAIKMSYLPLVQSILENSIVAIDHGHQNNNLQMALTIAAQLNNVEIVQLYLQNLLQTFGSTNTLNLNTFDEKLSTPLAYACRNGNFNAVKMMISLGANPNICKPQSIPLIEAVKSGNIQVVKLLLESGAVVTESDLHGNTALHNAVLVEKHRIVDLLLEYSANVHARNNKKQTPLHLAIERTKNQTNRSLRVEFSLIKKGADLNAIDFFGRTPLHYVFVDSNLIPITRNTTVIKKKIKLISEEIKADQEKQKLLAEYNSKYGLNEHANSHKESTARINNWMREAKERRLSQTLEKKLAENKDSYQEIVVLEEERDIIKDYYSYGWETEHIMPERFDPIDILKHLSDFNDVQFDLKDEFGRTPLHYAACVGAFSCTTLLIEKNVDINAVDTDNNGPLQLALRNNHIDYSVMLCNFGASVKSDIVLKDGKSTSSFGFSLSKSLINVAYLIMNKGVLLIESIRDALKNGKFHMAEVLLQSAKDQALSETLAEEGQNIWHIIADFKPFDNEIWLDYLEDILKRLDSLKLTIHADNYGRTPLHYAAKHGQSVLLKHLISINGGALSLQDQVGETEIDYAVLSGEVECVKTLLDAGSKVIKPHGSKNKSLVLKAVENSRFDIVELVLSHGALTDDQDSHHGFANSVMIACQQKNIKVLELLIKYGANLNNPSQIERKDAKNRVYKVMVHPIFIASTLDKRFLETMLKGGADPNVMGPKSKPEDGRTCFMYNVVINSIENQEMLLEYKVDINAFDEQTSRTIFYQFFFNKVSQVHTPTEDGSSKQAPKLNNSIYEKMIQQYQPEVNHIDMVTGMTPLELAIHEKNETIVERLLLFGANVNTESCNRIQGSTRYYNAMNPFGTALPAVLHAIIRGNLDILKLVCEKSIGSINWLWQDVYGNNMLSYVTGLVGGCWHSNIIILQYVKEQMEENTFTKLLQQSNHQGVSPILNAYHRENKELYNALLTLDMTLADFAAKHYDKDIFQTLCESSPMDIDYISTQSVDEDAQIEREKLQQFKNIQNASKKADIEEDESFKVDTYSKLEKVGSIASDENNLPYNIMLMKVELQSWGSDTDTSFYKLSIIYSKVSNVYILWTRWGPFGQEGQHQKTPFLTKDEAVTEFKSIFKSKTGNIWDHHRESFETKPGRYEIMKVARHPRDTIIENFDFLTTTVASELPLEVSNIMKLICNYIYLSRVYKDTNVDMPLGQIPQKRIEEARQILKDTYKLINTYSDLKRCYSDKTKIQESKVYAFRIAQKCVEYSRLMPRSGEANKPIRSLYNHNNSAIFEELSKIEDLSYVGFAANVILAAKHHADNVHPLDYAYHTLNCSLKSISSATSPSEYQLIKKYMDSTAPQPHELVHLFTVNRADEESRFRPFENEYNRKLLWHGSRVGNFMGILKQGLRVTPRTSNVINGAMLGNGIYFADTFAKSLNYSSEYYGDRQSTYRIMLLCEVALGPRQAVYQSNLEMQTENLDSMKGEGSNIPDPDNAVYDANGLCIPLGPCVPYVRPAPETPSIFSPAPLLNHNEYAVYNEDRVKIRYLLIIKESSKCTLCGNTGHASNLKPLPKHDLSDYKLMDFNNYEAELTKSYLLHTSNTAQTVYDEDLDAFIETALYKKKWNIPLDLKKEDKVCDNCAKQAATMMLEKRMTSEQNSIDVFELLNRKPQCKYGKECRTQNTVSHAKKYKHWFAEKISEDLEKDLSLTEFLEQNQYSSQDDEDYEGAEDEDEDSMETDDEDSMDTDNSADDMLI